MKKAAIIAGVVVLGFFAFVYAAVCTLLTNDLGEVE
jgi:hypothetical protein